MAQAVASYNWWKVRMNIMQLFTLSGIFLERCCSGLRLLEPFSPTHPHRWYTYYKGRVASFVSCQKNQLFCCCFFSFLGIYLLSAFVGIVLAMVYSRPSRFSLFFPLSLLSTLRPVYLIRIFLSFSGVYSRAFVRALCVCVCVQAVSGLLGKNAPPNTHRHTWTSGSRHDNFFFFTPCVCWERENEEREREKEPRGASGL